MLKEDVNRLDLTGEDTAGRRRDVLSEIFFAFSYAAVKATTLRRRNESEGKVEPNLQPKEERSDFIRT